MKMVVAYIDRAALEPIREAMFEMGFPAFSVTDAGGAMAEPAVTIKYRGTQIQNFVRPKCRFECVVEDEFMQQVVDTVTTVAGQHVFAFVTPVEMAVPEDYVKQSPLVEAYGS